MASRDLPHIRLELPDEDVIDRPFWLALADGALTIPRCGTCSRWTWPPQLRCAECGSWEFRWEALAPAGTVYSYAHAHHTTLEELRAYAPFTTLLVELFDSGGVRIMGLLETDEPVAIGDAVIGRILPAAANGERASIRWSRASFGERD